MPSQRIRVDVSFEMEVKGENIVPQEGVVALLRNTLGALMPSYNQWGGVDEQTIHIQVSDASWRIGTVTAYDHDTGTATVMLGVELFSVSALVCRGQLKAPSIVAVRVKQDSYGKMTVIEARPTNY